MVSYVCMCVYEYEYEYVYVCYCVCMCIAGGVFIFLQDTRRLCVDIAFFSLRQIPRTEMIELNLILLKTLPNCYTKPYSISTCSIRKLTPPCLCKCLVFLNLIFFSSGCFQCFVSITGFELLYCVLVQLSSFLICLELLSLMYLWVYNFHQNQVYLSSFLKIYISAFSHSLWSPISYPLGIYTNSLLLLFKTIFFCFVLFSFYFYVPLNLFQ